MFNNFITFLLKMWNDQRGEAGEELEELEEDLESGGEKPPEEEEEGFVLEVDDPEEDDPDDEAKAKAKAAEKAAEKDEDITKKFSDLETRLSERDSHVTDLNKAIHGLRKELKETKAEKMESGETVFTDSQLVSLLEEHKDDAPTLLQVVKHVAKQSAKGAEKGAIDQAAMSGTKKELDGFLSTTYPDLSTDGSEIRVVVDQTKDRLGLSDHPYGDFLGTGAMLLQNIESFTAQAREEGKQEALKEVADGKRKEDIKKKLPASPGGGKKKGSDVISSDVLKTAKQMGLNKAQTKIYAQMRANKNQKTVTVGD